LRMVWVYRIPFWGAIKCNNKKKVYVWLCRCISVLFLVLWHSYYRDIHVYYYDMRYSFLFLWYISCLIHWSSSSFILIRMIFMCASPCDMLPVIWVRRFNSRGWRGKCKLLAMSQLVCFISAILIFVWLRCYMTSTSAFVYVSIRTACGSILYPYDYDAHMTHCSYVICHLPAFFFFGWWGWVRAKKGDWWRASWKRRLISIRPCPTFTGRLGFFFVHLIHFGRLHPL
jgi:hypothetical protein